MGFAMRLVRVKCSELFVTRYKLFEVSRRTFGLTAPLPNGEVICARPAFAKVRRVMFFAILGAENGFVSMANCTWVSGGGTSVSRTDGCVSGGGNARHGRRRLRRGAFSGFSVSGSRSSFASGGNSRCRVRSSGGANSFGNW